MGYGNTKFRRKGFSRRGLAMYLLKHPGQKHRCGDAKHCVVANYIASEVKFPKGYDTVAVFGTRIEFSKSKQGIMQDTLNYDAPKWVDKVVRRFDRLRSKSGQVTSKRAAKQLADILG